MNRSSHSLSCLLLSLFAALPASAKSKDKVEHGTFTFNGAPREYLLQIPSCGRSHRPLPVVVLIHDQGGWATDVMGAWQGFASKPRLHRHRSRIPPQHHVGFHG